MYMNVYKSCIARVVAGWRRSCRGSRSLSAANFLSLAWRARGRTKVNLHFPRAPCPALPLHRLPPAARPAHCHAACNYDLNFNLIL
ncbi:unnamed protein product [Danaus chrysippus]|uniref:(African queen) hypothetical protein n=1 Tax=Danaus chrysippus TaxID=151541 RepID=A0A8J2WDK8_9NEOP|nr:unnamed protein product [Danaus chrysippus]